MNKEICRKQILDYVNLFNTYIYPDYPESKIASKQYAKNIILPYYAAKKTTFSYIFADANKLNELNKQGKDVGDTALKNSVHFFREVFPKDTDIIRLGGDEFIILLNDSKEQAMQYCHLVNEKLKQSKPLLSFSFGIADCSTSTSFSDLHQQAEAEVYYQKHQRSQASTLPKSSLPIPKNISSKEYHCWEKLNSSIDHALESHIQDLRPSSKFTYRPEDVKNESFYLLEEVAKLLNKKVTSSLLQKEKRTHQKKQEKFANLPLQDIQIIYELFKVHTLPSNLSNESLLSLKGSLTSLVEPFLKNENSGLLTKNYYRNYLSKELLNSAQQYQAIFFSASGIRVGNTAFGHDDSDLRIPSIPLVDTFSKYRCFNNKAFSFHKNDTFLIDLNGGNYIAWIPMEQQLVKSDFDHLRKDLDDALHRDTINYFPIAITHRNYISNATLPAILNQEKDEVSASTYHLFARFLKDECSFEKDPLKHEALKGYDNQIAFGKVIAPCIDSYLATIPNASDAQKQRFLLTNIFLSLIEHEAISNKKSIKEKKIIPQRD